MKNILIVILCCLGYSINVNAQAHCEFDSNYYWGSNSNGHSILEAKNSGFLLLGFSNLTSGIGNLGVPTLTLSKIDSCGSTLWRVKHDKGKSLFAELDDATVIGLIENSNEDIIYASSYYKGFSDSSGIRIIKTDKNGNLKWKYKFGDTSKYYRINRFIEITPDKYLFTGYTNSSRSSINNNKSRACAIIIDTSGNTLFQNEFNMDTSSSSSFTWSYKKAINEIELLGIEDSALLIIRIDTLGNLIYQQKIRQQIVGYKAISSLIVGNDTSEFILSGKINSKLYLARLSPDYSLIADTITDYEIVVFPKKISNNKYMFSFMKSYPLGSKGINLAITDNGFNIVWKDTTKYGSGINFYDFIESKDSSYVYIGSARSSTGMNINEYLIAKKKAHVIKHVGLIEESTLSNDVAFYPNPASSHFYLQSASSKIIAVHISDMSGKVIYHTPDNSDIDISSYSNGIYLLKIETNKGIVFKKLIINNH